MYNPLVRAKVQEGIESLKAVVLGGGTYLSGGLFEVSVQESRHVMLVVQGV